MERDLPDAEYHDFAKIVDGGICPCCKKKAIKVSRGIEVGNIFQLGTKYTKSMGKKYLDKDSKEKYPIMGCYGIGVTRTMSSIIEQNHDESGIIWPLNVAPYHAVIVPINYEDEVIKKGSDYIYDQLNDTKVEIILDDREAKPGFKFKDWELIGIPYIITVGRKACENICELKNRRTLEKVELSYDEVITFMKKQVENIK